MTSSHAARRLLIASMACIVALTGCGSGSDEASPASESPTTQVAESDGATGEAGGDDTALDEPTTAEDPEPPAEEPAIEPDPEEPTASAEVDPTGAEEIGSVAESMLAAMRASAETIDGGSSNDEVVAQFRELRDIAFEADSALRQVAVADPDLAGLVDDLIVTIGESIAAYDVVTTDPASAGPEQLVAVNDGSLALVSAGSALQDGAAAVAAGQPVPEGPTLFEVLPRPEDFPVVSGVRDPAYGAFLDVPVPTTESGPCGAPSPFLVVPPRAYADVALADPAFVGSFRVQSFADEAEAARYLDATLAFFGCREPEAVTIELTAEDGRVLVGVDVEGSVTTTLIQQVGNRVHVVNLTGDQIADPAQAAEQGRARVEALMAISLDKAGV